MTWKASRDTRWDSSQTMNKHPARDEWEDQAECSTRKIRKTLPFKVWVNPTPTEEKLAKEICVHHCNVRTECLRDALNDKYAEGVRAGYRFEDGAVSQEDADDIKKTFKWKPRRITEEVQELRDL